MMLTRAVEPISMTRVLAGVKGRRFAGLTALTPAARTVPGRPCPDNPGDAQQEGARKSDVLTETWGDPFQLPSPPGSGNMKWDPMAT